MENYLVEHETLAKLVDALIAKKYPNQTNASLGELREQSIKELDDRIFQGVFGELSSEQISKLNAILDNPNANEQDFQNFFSENNISLEEKIKEITQKYSEDFLGDNK